MSDLSGPNETLTRERVKEIFREKQYSYLEQKVELLEVRDDSLLLKISFLLEYKNRMITIEEKEPIAVPFKDFKIEDWGDGVRKSPISNKPPATARAPSAAELQLTNLYCKDNSPQRRRDHRGFFTLILGVLCASAVSILLG